MKKVLVLLVIIVLIVGISFAEEDNFGEHHRFCKEHEEGFGRNFGMHQRGAMGNGGMPFHEKMMDELDLTATQKDQIQEIMSDHHKFMIQKNSEIEILKIDIHKALRDHNFNEAKRITEKMSDLEKDIAVKRINMHEERWKMLTNEQKEKAEELIQDKPMMKMHKMMRNKHKMGKF